MHQPVFQRQRIISIALSTNGFGYTVMEGPASFVAHGVKAAAGDKNAVSLAKIKKLLTFYRPAVLVLQDVNAKGTRRSSRIKTLHHRMLTLARKRKLKVVTVSRSDAGVVLVDEPSATRYELAQAVANRFPRELARRLPPKRREWESENKNMAMFEAIGLAMVFWNLPTERK
jgi:hypothetical protein